MHQERERKLEDALKEALRWMNPMLPAYIAESDLYTEKEKWEQIKMLKQFMKDVKKLLDGRGYP